MCDFQKSAGIPEMSRLQVVQRCPEEMSEKTGIVERLGKAMGAEVRSESQAQNLQKIVGLPTCVDPLAVCGARAGFREGYKNVGGRSGFEAGRKFHLQRKSRTKALF